MGHVFVRQRSKKKGGCEKQNAFRSFKFMVRVMIDYMVSVNDIASNCFIVGLASLLCCCVILPFDCLLE